MQQQTQIATVVVDKADVADAMQVGSRTLHRAYPKCTCTVSSNDVDRMCRG